MKHIHYYILGVMLSVFVQSCTEKVDNMVPSDKVPTLFPDYVGVTIPSTIAPMNFSVEGDVDKVDVVVKGSKGGEMHVQGDYADFNIDDWHAMVVRNKGGKLTFTVCTKNDGVWTRYRDFEMYVSNYDMPDYGLTYRRIAPGYEVYSHMGLYERRLDNFEERALIENTQVTGMCVNCHTSNRTNPDNYVFHVRGDHGATLIHNKGNVELLKAKNDSIKGSLVYPYWHPSGKYCAFSTNQTKQGFHVVKDERVEVFDLSSDVLVYDVAKHEIILDTLLATKPYSENSPVFSADGKTLYYLTCLQQNYPENYKNEKYNICRVSFNPDNGTFGDRVDTIYNAVEKGKTATWPRPSYDGRYIMFTQMDYGYFSIWHKESDLWLLDLATMEAHPLTTANSNDADSFHNWSAGSHWFVFTSRRDDGLYTNLYLSCVDGNGNATKAFLLPQRNPKEYYMNTVYSFNTPDFTSHPVDIDSRSVSVAIESDKRIDTKVR
ncbi:MAG: TolB family protein [Prevotella sp.]